jgi:hypothetical protein
MDNFSRSAEGAGLDHLDFVQVNVDGGHDEVVATLQGVQAVVSPSLMTGRLRDFGVPESLEIIEEDRVLDQGGIEMLGKMLRQLPRATSVGGE